MQFSFFYLFLSFLLSVQGKRHIVKRDSSTSSAQDIILPASTFADVGLAPSTSIQDLPISTATADIGPSSSTAALDIAPAAIATSLADIPVIGSSIQDSATAIATATSQDTGFPSTASSSQDPSPTDTFDFNTLLGSFVALSTIRDDACIQNAANCKITQGGRIDPGAIGGNTQCGQNALDSGLVGLDSAHFGSQSNGVRTSICGRTVSLFNPVTGLSATGIASDRILQNAGPGNGGSSQVDLSSDLNSQLGSDGSDNIDGIQVTIS